MHPSTRRLCLLPLLVLAPVLAQAGVKLEIRGVEDTQRDAVRAAVELSQYTDRDVSDAAARRLFLRARRQAAQALEPYGYFDARAEGEIEKRGADWHVVLRVTPGEPVKITNVDIQLDAAARELPEVRRAVRAFRPRKGQVLNQGEYAASRDAIGAALTETGYLQARLVTRRVEVRRAEHAAEVKLAWNVGPRYRYGEVRFQGSQISEHTLGRYVPFEHGDYFSQTQLLELQQALTGADYFAVVNVQPEIVEGDEALVDVVIDLAPAKRSIYTGGPFIGTDTGFGVRGGVERRWVNRRGHKWKNEIVYAQRLKTASTLYSIPLPGPDQRSYNFGANYRDANTSTSKSRTLELVGNETRQWHGWTRTLGVHALAGTFTVGKRGNEPDDAPGIDHGRSQLVFAEASLIRKRADNPDFVRNGWMLQLVGRSTVGSLLSDTRYTQVMADAKWIHALGRRDRLILRGSVGQIASGDFSRLPPQLRFFAGGDRSVRGYGYQSLGPYNAYDRVIGGHNLTVLSSEVEHYFSRNWGMAAFVDTGNAFDGTDYRPKIGAGLGMRWRSPVGMIRVDLGVPVRNPDKHGVQLHLVIGPDL